MQSELPNTIIFIGKIKVTTW